MPPSAQYNSIQLRQSLEQTLIAAGFTANRLRFYQFDDLMVKLASGETVCACAVCKRVLVELSTNGAAWSNDWIDAFLAICQFMKQNGFNSPAKERMTEYKSLHDSSVETADEQGILDWFDRVFTAQL